MIGPDAEVSREDIAALYEEAAAAGDDATVRLCQAALDDSGDKAAWTLLRTHIRDTRMREAGGKG